jgi:hypothetical protein
MLPSSFDFASQFEHNRSALLNELTRGIEEALVPFQIALDGFLAGLSRDVLPSNWREEWEAFVIEQQTQGFTVDPTSVEEIKTWIESWAKEFDLWPEEVQAFEDDDFDFDPEESYFIISVIPDVSGPGGGKKGKTIVEVVTKTHLPADWRGDWIKGSKGNGTFKFNNELINRQRGIVGVEVKFEGGSIAVGGFPPEAYYRGSAAKATVTIETVTGTSADNTACDAAMREKLDDPTWKRSKRYRWNHAGPPGSKVMELILKKFHTPVAHSGGAAKARSRRRKSSIAKSNRPPRKGKGTTGKGTTGKGATGKGATGRAMGALTVYLTARDALQAVGVLQPDYYVLEGAEYYFATKDGAVFVVWTGGWFTSARREFIAGPRKGDSEKISNQDVKRYTALAEKKWGRYIPGGPFREPQFMPGTERKSLPLVEVDENGFRRSAGWIDEKGVHRIEPIGPGMQ